MHTSNEDHNSLSTSPTGPVESDLFCPDIPALEQLKKQPNWVVFKLEYKPGRSKPRKPPYNARTERRADATDPQTWSTYLEALAASQLIDETGEVIYFGKGFATDGTGIAFIDLDECRDPETGEIHPWAWEVIRAFHSYTEVSPSGTGIHIYIWMRTGFPKQGGKRKGGIEMYSEGQYFTFSGDHVPDTPLYIDDRTEQALRFHAELFGTEVEVTPDPALSVVHPLSDDEVLSLFLESEPKWRAIYQSGNFEEKYESHSEADLGMCRKLAFWTQRDAKQIDSLMRGSGLMRTKWDQRFGSSTYGAVTIDKAIESCHEVYVPPKHPRRERSAEYPDFEYGLSDRGNAERLVRDHGQEFCYCPELKQFIVWDETRWCPDLHQKVKVFASKLSVGIRREAAKEGDKQRAKAISVHAASCESNARINAALSMAQIYRSVEKSSFDAKPYVLNVLNGTIDLTTGRLNPHDQADMLMSQCPVVYDPDARSDTFERFLWDISLHDEQWIQGLQLAIGSSLLGDASEETIYVACGPGGSGKGTMLQPCADVLGNYSWTASFDTFIKSYDGGKGRTDDIADFEGKRFILASESNKEAKFNSAVLKMISGRDKISARRLYQSAVNFKSTAVLWFMTNNIPQMDSDDSGMERRLVVIPFEKITSREERKKEIKTELSNLKVSGPALLAWMVRGAVIAYQGGLFVPERFKKATDAMWLSMDPLAPFFREYCSLDPTAVTLKKDMSSAFELYKKKGFLTDINQAMLADTLKRQGVTDDDRSRVDGKQPRRWTGIGLLPPVKGALFAEFGSGR